MIGRPGAPCAALNAAVGPSSKESDQRSTPALQAIPRPSGRRSIPPSTDWETGSGYAGPPLMVFNNRPGTTAADVTGLVQRCGTEFRPIRASEQSSEAAAQACCLSAIASLATLTRRSHTERKATNCRL